MHTSWNATGLDRVVRYEVWRSQGGDPAVLAGSVDADADNEIRRRERYSFVDSTLAPTGTYRYWVIARDLYENQSDVVERVEVAFPR